MLTGEANDLSLRVLPELGHVDAGHTGHGNGWGADGGGHVASEAMIILLA